MMLKTSLQRICSNLAIIEAIMAGTNSLKRFLKKTPSTEKPKDKQDATERTLRRRGCGTD